MTPRQLRASYMDEPVPKEPQEPRAYGMWQGLMEHVGRHVMASGMGGCYQGVLYQVYEDGVIVETDDGSLVALGMAGLELALRGRGDPHAGPPMSSPFDMPVTPSMRGVPPEEDI